jgi:3',5'-cyclic AMP phosphodiesterase CpdA
MSSMSSFQTAPLVGSTQKIVVGVWGDTQNNEFNTQFEKSKIIVDKMLKHPIQFSIHMGDIIDEGSDAESWQAFLTVSQPLNIRAPFMPVTGNHDVVNDESRPDFQKPFQVYNDLFNLPRNNLDYSYDYGNTHFIAISSGHAKGAESTGNFLYAKGSKEYKWLEKDLAKARKNKKIKWIILYMHHPLQSYGWSHVKGWQERIAPLVDKYQVDLCLQGHRHVYERHHALRNNEVVGRGDAHLYEKPQGTVYITNGTSGGSPQGLGGHNMASMAFTSNEKMYNYAIMTIEGETLYYDVFNQFDERIDYFQIKK